MILRNVVEYNTLRREPDEDEVHAMIAAFKEDSEKGVDFIEMIMDDLNDPRGLVFKVVDESGTVLFQKELS